MPWKAPNVPEKAITIGAEVFWGQVGVYDDRAAALAEEAILRLVRLGQRRLRRRLAMPPRETRRVLREVGGIHGSRPRFLPVVDSWFRRVVGNQWFWWIVWH